MKTEYKLTSMVKLKRKRLLNIFLALSSNYLNDYLKNKLKLYLCLIIDKCQKFIRIN
jgi:hypothetical protein